jgi:hypothetical protein
VERGLDFTEPRLYVLDGGKALTAAVKKHAGESAAIQRCQVHKRRNVLDHLTDEQKPAVAKKLNAAYALEDYAAAKQALNLLHRELMDLNPSAARSLGEGMEETLTVHRLHLPMQLRKTMASTNVIESAFSIGWTNSCSSRSFTRCICSKKESGAWCKKRRNVCGSGKLGSPVRYWKVPLKRKNDAVSRRSNPSTTGYTRASIIWDRL